MLLTICKATAVLWHIREGNFSNVTAATRGIQICCVWFPVSSTCKWWFVPSWTESSTLPSCCKRLHKIDSVNILDKEERNICATVRQRNVSVTAKHALYECLYSSRKHRTLIVMSRCHHCFELMPQTSIPVSGSCVSRQNILITYNVLNIIKKMSWSRGGE